MKLKINLESEKALKKSLDELDFRIIRANNSMTDDVFLLLTTVIDSDKFLLCNYSNDLLIFILSNWEYMSSEQKEVLLPKLENIYTKIANWHSVFVISTILGELYQNNQSFESLCRLKAISNEEGRAFVAFGIGQIARYKKNTDLGKKALSIIIEMKKDPSEKVKHEVELAFQRLKN